MLAPVENSNGGSSAERRAGERQRLTLRVAKLRCASGEYPCIVCDVSGAGVRLRLLHDHPPDTHLFLELAGGDLFAIERRWIEGEFAGFRFSSKVDVEEFLHERGPKPRRPLRLRLHAPVQFVAAGERGHAQLVDLSSQGACIEGGRQIAAGALLRLEIPGAASRLAAVCWRREFRHGLAFQQPLSLAELASLAVRLQPFDAEAAKAIGEPDLARAIGA